MIDKITDLLLPKKKVSLSDVASPKPSRAAKRAVDRSLRQACKDQNDVSQKAHELKATR